VRWGTTDLATLPEAARDAWRRQHAGFVFQDFHLIPGLSILGNVLVTCWFDHWRADPVMTERAGELLDRFGVPSSGWQVQKLSRGEQQRVAIARALPRSPAILIADEPTASLDAKSGGAVIEILLDQARQTAATLLVVTHDPELSLLWIPPIGSITRGRLPPRHLAIRRPRPGRYVAARRRSPAPALSQVPEPWCAPVLPRGPLPTSAAVPQSTCRRP
jgi:putative ABC transport system ATP-binding protein